MKMTTKLKPEHLIHVCDNCLCATCWHGDLMCDHARSAGETVKTVAELRELGIEDESHWIHQEEVTGSPLKLKNSELKKD